ncbi:hypothetical protein [Thalassospira alkalitolerans]|uniref:hypothetical protein n=1 Tax=Thalassospira alkalitolerans TaxID=1293890 RepID=UPI003AA8451A
MFVDSPFWLAILVSGVIATVLMLALWLGLDRGVARRMVLAAVIPAVAVAVPAAIGLPETARGGVGAALLMLVLGGVCGAILDFSHLRHRTCAIVAGVLMLLGGWLVLAAPVSGLLYHPGGLVVLVWIAFILIGACFLWVTRPNFDEDETPEITKGKGKKSTRTPKAAKAKTSTKSGGTGDGDIAKPAPVATFMALSIGQGIVAAQFGLHDHVVFQAGLSMALLVALISEKAAPQYRAALWLAVSCALMASGSGVMLAVPASVFAMCALVLVVFAGSGGARIAGLIPAAIGAGTGAAGAVLAMIVRLSVLALPVLVAWLIAYIGATMQGVS